nr:hypothetical protein [Mesorhizobium waimense]
MTPSLALHDDGRGLAFGTPGWRPAGPVAADLVSSFCASRVVTCRPASMRRYSFAAFPGVIFPRQANPGRLMLEVSLGEATIARLRELGHEVVVSPANTIGRLTAALRHPNA